MAHRSQINVFMKTSLKIQTVLLFSTFALSNYTFAETQAVACRKVVAVQADSYSKKLDWKSDFDLLSVMQKREILARVQSFKSEKYQTEIFFTATARPNHKGEIPLVDKNAKAVYVFAHGSGTMKSGGRNFIGNMNTLANLGYAAVSIDFPFHSNGPRSEEFKRLDHVMLG